MLHSEGGAAQLLPREAADAPPGVAQGQAGHNPGEATSLWKCLDWTGFKIPSNPTHSMVL